MGPTFDISGVVDLQPNGIKDCVNLWVRVWVMTFYCVRATKKNRKSDFSGAPHVLICSFIKILCLIIFYRWKLTSCQLLLASIILFFCFVNKLEGRWRVNSPTIFTSDEITAKTSHCCLWPVQMIFFLPQPDLMVSEMSERQEMMFLSRLFHPGFAARRNMAEQGLRL